MGTIGARIKKRRQVLGMKQHELAAAVGVDRSAVSNWERGRHFPLRYQGKVEDVLGISLDEQPQVPEVVRRHWDVKGVRELWEITALPPEVRAGLVAHFIEMTRPGIGGTG